MVDIPTKEPAEIVRGDTLKWRREDLSTDYPAPTWTLTYDFAALGHTGTIGKITAAADGVNFAVTVPKATAAAYGVGNYNWAAFVDDGTERHRVDFGTVEVVDDLALPASSDQRSHCRKVLDAVEAVIEGRAVKDQESFKIEGLELSRTPIKDLIRFRLIYRAEVRSEMRAERVRNGAPSGRFVRTRF